MNILFISPSDPADHSTGGAQRSQFLHRALSELGTVYTVVPVPLKELEREDAERRVAHRCLYPRKSLRWLCDGIIRRLCPLLRLPLVRNPRRHIGFDGVRFDYVAVRYTHWASHTRAWAIAPLLLDIDDLPTESFATLHAPEGKGFFARLGHRLKAWQIKHWSARVFESSAGLWIANPEHVPLLRHPNAHWLPNLPRDPQPFEPLPTGDADFILSIGYLGYSANYEGIDRFITQVWPGIRAKHPALEYWIVGKDLPKSLLEKWNRIPGARVLGFVDNIDRLYSRCLFSVAPIYAGSGTCIKVLESMRQGRVCLVSPFAARGMGEVRPDCGVVVGHSDAEMLEKALWLLDQPESRKQLQVAAVDTVSRGWSFEKFMDQVKAAQVGAASRNQ